MIANLLLQVMVVSVSAQVKAVTNVEIVSQIKQA
jgi:hypothetical protein